MDYDQRQCPACTNRVEDDVHANFHCRTYAQQLQSLHYEELFDSAHSLRSFLASDPPHRVAALLIDCQNARLLSQRDEDLDSLLSVDHDA